jgi:hypothetical protein
MAQSNPIHIPILLLFLKVKIRKANNGKNEIPDCKEAARN